MDKAYSMSVSTFKLPYCARFQQHPWYATNGRLWYRGADKSLTRPGRKQATVTEDFDFHLIYNHNWRNISTIYSIK